MYVLNNSSYALAGDKRLGVFKNVAKSWFGGVERARNSKILDEYFHIYLGIEIDPTIRWCYLGLKSPIFTILC